MMVPCSGGEDVGKHVPEHFGGDFLLLLRGVGLVSPWKRPLQRITQLPEPLPDLLDAKAVDEKVEAGIQQLEDV